MKTAAVLLLLLIASAASEGLRKVSESGAFIVLLHEMLQIINSWGFTSSQMEAASASDSSQLVHDQNAVSTPQSLVWAQEMAASLPFIAASQDLAQCILVSGVNPVRAAGLMATGGLLSTCFALSCSGRKPLQTAAKHADDSMLSKTGIWLHTRAAGLISTALVLGQCTNLLPITETTRNMHDLVLIAQQMKAFRKQCESMLDSTKGYAAERCMQLFVSLVCKNPLHAAMKQVERDASARSCSSYFWDCTATQTALLVTFTRKLQAHGLDC